MNIPNLSRGAMLFLAKIMENSRKIGYNTTLKCLILHHGGGWMWLFRNRRLRTTQQMELEKAFKEEIWV